jgi:hypothetical protein
VLITACMDERGRSTMSTPGALLGQAPRAGRAHGAGAAADDGDLAVEFVR